jgi:hypothetical protein
VGTVPRNPKGKRTLVIVPVTNVSRLTEHAISEALSLGQEVIAISVVIDQGDEGERARRPCGGLGRVGSRACARDPAHRVLLGGRADRGLHRRGPGAERPADRGADPGGASPTFRYRILHNQIDVVLSAALRTRPDIVVARVPMPLGTFTANTRSHWAAEVPARRPPAPIPMLRTRPSRPPNAGDGGLHDRVACRRVGHVAEHAGGPGSFRLGPARAVSATACSSRSASARCGSCTRGQDRGGPAVARRRRRDRRRAVSRPPRRGCGAGRRAEGSSSGTAPRRPPARRRAS